MQNPRDTLMPMIIKDKSMVHNKSLQWKTIRFRSHFSAEQGVEAVEKPH